MAEPEPETLFSEARLTGSQALARAVHSACTRVAVICPEIFLSEIYRDVCRLSDPDRGLYICGPAKGKVGIREAFRSAMENRPSVFVCGGTDGFHVRKAARQLEHLVIPGGLVLVGDVARDSPRQGQDKTRIPLQIQDPGSPREIYGSCRQAAELALKQRRLVYLRVAGRLWGERGRLGRSGGSRLATVAPVRQCRAQICRECPRRDLVTAVRETLAVRGIFVTAMACHGPGHLRSPVVGRPLPPAQECGASGIWMETSDESLVVFLGEGVQVAGSIDDKARDLGVKRIFHCQPPSRDGLASAIRAASAWQGGAAVCVQSIIEAEKRK